jgi:hypothetical protein
MREFFNRYPLLISLSKERKQILKCAQNITILKKIFK